MQYMKGFLERIYRMMLCIRYSEEAFVEPIIDGRISCPAHLYSGQEAVAVGVCAALEECDYVFGTHRSHGHYLAKGGDLKEMVAEIFLRETGCAKGRGGSMHLTAPEKGVMGVAPIVGGTISLALGAALGASIRKDQRISVSFFGDGATGEGVLFESMNFAQLHHLPILFVCENNLYSTHMPIRDCRPSECIVEIASAFGMERARVDGNDVLAVYETALRAVTRCREGGGPFFLECLTYRLRGHVGPNDNIQGQQTDMRSPEEIESWREKDPITRFERQLFKEQRFAQEELEDLRSQVAAEVQEAFSFAIASPHPRRESLNDYVFSE